MSTLPSSWSNSGDSYYLKYKMDPKTKAEMKEAEKSGTHPELLFTSADEGTTHPSTDLSSAQPEATPDNKLPPRLDDSAGLSTARQGHISVSGLGGERRRLGPITFDKSLMQTFQGDCYALAAINALSQTTEGAKLMGQSILDKDANGDYYVEFLGEPGTIYKVPESSVSADLVGDKPGGLGLSPGYMPKYIYDLTTKNSYGAGGDLGERILLSALKQRGDRIGKPLGEGGSSGEILSLLAQRPEGYEKGVTVIGTGGGTIVENKIFPSFNTDKIKQILRSTAPRLGKDVAMTADGWVNALSGNMDWDVSKGGGQHVVSISRIDLNGPDGGTVHYQNPWDPSVDRTVSLNEFAKGSTDSIGLPLILNIAAFGDPVPLPSQFMGKTKIGFSTSLPTIAPDGKTSTLSTPESLQSPQPINQPAPPSAALAKGSISFMS